MNYRCPKCKQFTLEYSEWTNALTCSHIDFQRQKSCGFKLPMPADQTQSPNDGQVLAILAKHKQ